jgi:hypothetical protein
MKGNDKMLDLPLTENNNNIDEKDKQIIRRMQMKPEFYRKYENAKLQVRELFMKLIIMAEEKSIINKATKNDYRLVKKNGINNFCLINILSDSLGLHIHRNNSSLQSDILNFSSIKDGNHSGKDWIAIKVGNDIELDDAIRLINTIYQKS